MSDLPATQPLKKLPVWAMFREAFGFAWGHRGELWSWILIGALLAGLVDLVNLIEYGEENDALAGFPYFAIIFLTPIPSLLVFALLAVYCHRTFLLNHFEESRQIQFFFTGRERKFFAWIFGIPFLIVVVIFPAIFVVGIIFYGLSEGHLEIFLKNDFVMGLVFYGGFLLPFYYIFGRWSLVFPAIAIDQEPKLGWSWNQTRENGWRLFVLVGFLPLTVGNLWYLLEFTILSETPMLSSSLASFTLFLFTPVEVAVISIAFRELTNWTPTSPSSESL